jgi:hypothetical protein
MTRLSTTLAGILLPSCRMHASGAWSGSRIAERTAHATGA